MNRKKFENIVREAIMALTEKIGNVVDNVAFIVESEPRREKANEKSIRRNEILIGLYEGIPKTERGSGYFWVLPDKITIFQKPIEELSGRSEKKLKKLVNETVWHEVGHHLGFDEKKIRALEAKRKKK